MAAPSQPKSNVKRVPIFRSGHEGFGDSRRAARQNSYHRVGSGTVDLRWPGEMREGLEVFRTTLSFNEPPVAAVNWTDTSGNDLMLVAAGTASLYRYGIATLGIQREALAQTATGLALHDDGGGVPYLYIAEGGAVATFKVQRRDRAGVLTTCTNLYADKLLSIANDLYVTFTPAGGTANCMTGIVPAGTNPLAAAQPAGTVVGFAGSPINGIGHVRYAPIMLKPEGIFTYDRNSNTWINHAPWLEAAPHPDTGKVFWYEGTDLCMALGYGGAIRFNGVVAIPYDPLPIEGTTPDADTTTQIIAAAGTTRHWGVLVTKAGGKRQRMGGQTAADGAGATPSGPALLKTTDSGGTYTDYSSLITTPDPATEATLDALAGDGTAWFLVGHTQPFMGVYFKMGTGVNTNTPGLTPAVWNGTAWAPAASIADMTISPGTLGRSGWILGLDDPVQTRGWVRSTINGITAYWMRFLPFGLFSAVVRVNALDLLPYRPSLDAAVFPLDSPDRSGALPHIFFSRTDQQGNHVVHDYGHLYQPDEIGAVVYGSASISTTNDDRFLTFWGKRNIWSVPGNPDDRPQTFSWPFSVPLVPSANPRLVELPGVDLGGVMEVTRFIIDGFDWRRTGYLYYRFEDGRPWSLAGRFSTLPAEIEVRASGRAGQMLHVAVGWTRTGAEGGLPLSPRIVLCDADVEPSAVRPVRMPRTQAAPVV